MIQFILVSVLMGSVAWFILYQLMKKEEWSRQKLVIAGIVFGAVGILAGFVFHLYGYFLSKTVRLLVLLYGMLIIAIIDRKKHIIPNNILLVLLGCRTGLMIVEVVLYSSAWVEILTSAFTGMIVGAIIFIIVYFLSRQGIGMGDVKLIAVIGYYLGINALYSVIIFSLIGCILYSVVQLIRKKVKMKDFIAFGPFLTFGTIVTLFIGI